MSSKGFLIFLFWGVLAFHSLVLYGEPQGYKYIKNYPPNEYNHVNQNWCVIQDKRGIIYIGNRAGLLEFDGVYWRVINIPNNTVRSLALHHDGTVYIGGINEMGFLTADKAGRAKYMSLVSHLDRELKKDGIRDRVAIMIGGAPVTQSFADEIGADLYAPDASVVTLSIS